MSASNWEAATPGLLLCVARPATGPKQHLFKKLFSQGLGMSHADDSVGRGTKQGHSGVPRAARINSCGWGHVRGCESQRKSVGPQHTD